MYKGGSQKKNELINEFIVNVAEVDQRKRHKWISEKQTIWWFNEFTAVAQLPLHL